MNGHLNPHLTWTTPWPPARCIWCWSPGRRCPPQSALSGAGGGVCGTFLRVMIINIINCGLWPHIPGFSHDQISKWRVSPDLLYPSLLYIIYLHAPMTCPSMGHRSPNCCLLHLSLHINIYCFKLNTIAKLVISPPLQLQLRGVCTLLCFVHSHLSRGLLSMNQIQQCAVQLFFLIPISYFIDILQTEKFTILPIWCLSTI